MSEPGATNPMRILVTGASGFVGSGLIPALAAAGHHVRAALRTPMPLPPGVEGAIIGDLTKPANRASAFEGIDAVVHGAGLTPAEPDLTPERFWEINTEAALDLARIAARAGVGRFVFLSSVRAQTGPRAEHVLTEDMEPQPTDAFGRSKLATERGLAALDLSCTILRPALAHGPGMRFNMARLLQLARLPYPLPLGGFRARRSILARDHLVDAILLALHSDEMGGNTYLVADPEPLTVGEMVACLRRGLGRPGRIVSVPPILMAQAARLMSRPDLRDQIARIEGPLVVSAARLAACGWHPRTDTRAALEATGRRAGAGGPDRHAAAGLDTGAA